MEMEYKGYKIYKNCKSVYKINPISGHHWAERVEQKGYTVSGKGIPCTRVFNNIKAAKEHIDFVLKFPFEIPRSEKEIARAKKLGLKD